MSVRVATPDDAKSILDIYRPHIEVGVASFETEVPSIETMQERIFTGLQRFPWLVYEDKNSVVGYCYAGIHRQRIAYQWVCETSVYIEQTAHRRGIAKILYAELFAILNRLGYYRLYAGITLPNSASEGLHQSFGFKKIGVYANIGYKFNSWHDVIWYEKILRNPDANPQPPLAFATINL